MAENVLKIRVEGELAYIALNRPEKRNAINQAMLRAIPEALDELDRSDVRAIIIYGEGQAFSAGIDFTSLTNDTGAQGARGGGRAAGDAGSACRVGSGRRRHHAADANGRLRTREGIDHDRADDRRDGSGAIRAGEPGGRGRNASGGGRGTGARDGAQCA